MDRLLDFLAGPKEMETEDGETLRLLTAMEVLQARREAEELAQEDRERALCANACLHWSGMASRCSPPDGRCWRDCGWRKSSGSARHGESSTGGTTHRPKTVRARWSR